MRRALSVILFIALLGCMYSAAIAAELLDVKPVVSGGAVSVEISADTAMTYTYYKVPGQARAVVDIAEADPEKVEPLIVVNKGAVASISVDKAEFSGIIVSRLIFNLVSETEIAVAASPDRKKLTVTFGGTSAVPAKAETKPEPKPETETKQEPETKAEVAPAPVVKSDQPPAAPPATTDAPEDDPLGLDEPAAKPAAAAAVKAVAAAVALESTVPQVAPPVARAAKLEPVVPAQVPVENPSALIIKEIATGASYIEIRANQPITDYKVLKLSAPQRVAIDIATEKTTQKPKSYTINKFGISKTRIGVSPKSIRVVFDSAKAGFPVYTITNSENGLRINFK